METTLRIITIFLLLVITNTVWDIERKQTKIAVDNVERVSELKYRSQDLQTDIALLKDRTEFMTKVMIRIDEVGGRNEIK